MEAFGLFNLLQSLLPKTEERAENARNDGGAPSPLPDSESPENGTKNGVETSMQNACLDFLARHDERVKNVRKR